MQLDPNPGLLVKKNLVVVLLNTSVLRGMLRTSGKII